MNSSQRCRCRCTARSNSTHRVASWGVGCRGPVAGGLREPVVRCQRHLGAVATCRTVVGEPARNIGPIDSPTGIQFARQVRPAQSLDPGETARHGRHDQPARRHPHRLVGGNVAARCGVSFVSARDLQDPQLGWQSGCSSPSRANIRVDEASRRSVAGNSHPALGCDRRPDRECRLRRLATLATTSEVRITA